jgi:hypothetical protein
MQPLRSLYLVVFAQSCFSFHTYRHMIFCCPPKRALSLVRGANGRAPSSDQNSIGGELDRPRASIRPGSAISLIDRFHYFHESFPT